MIQPSLKIAHIATVDLSLRYLLLNQLQSLQAAGYEVIGISTLGPDVSVIEAAGIRHIPVPLTRNVTPLTDLKALWQLVRVLRRERPAIVHGHTPKAELLGQLAARLAGVPVVVDTFRGIYYRPEMHPLWRRLFIAMSRLAAACADVVLSQSRWAIDLALEERICPPHKIKWLGNGIDVGCFDRDRLDDGRLQALRQELGLPSGAPVVGFVGRLVREKGIEELLAAAWIIRQQQPVVKFLLVGPVDPAKPDALTPAVAAQHGLADACIFTGLRNDMPELYALMDVFVLPTHRESFPRAPMEASAMGVPCVVSNIPGCREVVEHRRNGLLVPVGDPQALAYAILWLLTEPALAHSLGIAGQQLARERFDEQFIFARVKAEYTRLLQEKGLLPPQVTIDQ